jgi:hypothetical protein
MSDPVEERHELTKQIVSLDEKMERSKGWEIYKRKTELDDCFYILDTNYLEFYNFINEYQTNFNAIRYKTKYAEDNQTIKRLLFNYLSIAYSFELLFNEIMKKIDNVRVFNKYMDNKRSFFKEAGRNQFIKRLRTAIQHFHLIEPSTRLKITQNNGKWDIDYSISFSRDKLLEYRKDEKHWKAKGYEYLSNLPEQIRILDLIKSYNDDMYQFFFSTLEEINLEYEEELDKTAKINTLKQKLLSQVFDNS